MSSADGTYQLTGPASAAAARAVLFVAPPQQKGGWDSLYSLTTAFGNNADILIQGPSGSITLAYVVAGASTPLSVVVTSNAIVVNLATDASSNPTQTDANAIVAALRASSAVQALGVGVVRAPTQNGSGRPGALTATALTGGAASTRGPQSDAPFPAQHPAHNNYGQN
jgi:hypothetical protein